ncbi:MAG: family 20 glycosylhydrolase [Bifidobacterium bifidum]
MRDSEANIGSKRRPRVISDDIGVFYGTRSVSQMLRQGQLTLPAGTVATKPKYKERGATLCACQINISTDWIDRFLSDMADLRLNYVLLEMKLKPEEDNTKKAATWSYYTRDDVKKFVKKANNYGIDVIPEINSPGHMNVWLENYPEYQLADNSGRKDPNKLDISNPEAVKFYKTLIDEYDGVFTTKYWHMGADEYMIGTSFDNYSKLKTFAEKQYGAGATPNDAFTGFINDIDKYVKAKGQAAAHLERRHRQHQERLPEQGHRHRILVWCRPQAAGARPGRIHVDERDPGPVLVPFGASVCTRSTPQDCTTTTGTSEPLTADDRSTRTTTN